MSSVVQLCDISVNCLWLVVLIGCVTDVSSYRPPTPELSQHRNYFEPGVLLNSSIPPDCDLDEDQQSPIYIQTSDALQVGFQDFKFANYKNKLKYALLENDENSAILKVVTKSSWPYLQGGPLQEGAKYLFRKLRFRWGKDNTKGSDHVIDGKRYPLEAQFIHFNTKYANYKQALTKIDGIAVLSFVFKVSSTMNKKYQPITSKLVSVQQPGNPVKVDFKRLSDLLPTWKRWNTNYYTYQGTLTPPHCFNSVTWIVFRRPIDISKSQVEEFRKLVTTGGRALTDNHSKPKVLGCRALFYGVSS